jgi:hypothetical protein
VYSYRNEYVQTGKGNLAVRHTPFRTGFNDLAGSSMLSLCICTSQAAPRRKAREPIIASTYESARVWLISGCMITKGNERRSQACLKARLNYTAKVKKSLFAEFQDETMFSCQVTLGRRKLVLAQKIQRLCGLSIVFKLSTNWKIVVP